MTEPLILAVDLGTSGMKVALLTVGGKVLGWEFEPVGLLIESCDKIPGTYFSGLLKSTEAHLLAVFEHTEIIDGTMVFFPKIDISALPDVTRALLP